MKTKSIRKSILLRSVFTVSLLVFQTHALAEILSLKLSDIENIAMKNNTSISGYRLNYQTQKERRGFLLRSFLPTIRVIGGIEAFHTGNYPNKQQPYGSLETNLNLFNGFRDRYEAELQTAQINSSLSTATLDTVEEISSARELYRELAFYKQMQGVWESIKESNEAGYASAKRRLNRGLVSETDALEFKIYRSQIEEEISSNRHEMQLTSLKLSTTLGIPVTSEIDPLDPIDHVHDESLLRADFSEQTTAQGQQLVSQELISSLRRKKAQSWWLPSVDAYGQLALYTLRDRDYLPISARDDWAVGVRATWVLFDGMSSIIESRTRSMEQDSTEKIIHQKTRENQTTVKVAQEELRHLHELIHAAEERSQAGLKYLKSTRSDYERGVKNSPDLIAAIEKYVSFQKEEIERRKSYYTQREKLLKLTVVQYRGL